MISEPATVVDASPGGLVLQSGRKSSCSRCSLKPGCGHHLLAAPHERLELPMPDIANAGELNGLSPGARVELEVEPGQVLRLSFLFYVLPLAGLLLGTLAALPLALGEAGTAASAAIGLVLGLGYARAALRRGQPRVQISVTRQALATKESCL